MPPISRDAGRHAAGAWRDQPLTYSRHRARRISLYFWPHALAQELRTSRALGPIDVRATRITSFDTRDPAQLRFGALEFRGGLALTSNTPAVGGISALHMEPDGSHFLALTDNGSWLRARIVYEDGKRAGIADAEMAPMLGGDGRPLAAPGWFNTESLAEADGMLYVGIERVENRALQLRP